MKKSNNPQVYWEDQINKQASSNLTQGAYCKKESITLSTFKYYKQKLKSSHPNHHAWAEIKLESETHKKPLDQMILECNEVKIHLNDEISYEKLKDILILLKSI